MILWQHRISIYFDCHTNKAKEEIGVYGNICERIEICENSADSIA